MYIRFLTHYSEYLVLLFSLWPICASWLLLLSYQNCYPPNTDLIKLGNLIGVRGKRTFRDCYWGWGPTSKSDLHILCSWMCWLLLLGRWLSGSALYRELESERSAGKLSPRGGEWRKAWKCPVSGHLASVKWLRGGRGYEKQSEDLESKLLSHSSAWSLGWHLSQPRMQVSHSVHQTLAPSPQCLSALPLRPRVLFCIIILWS